LILKDQLLKMVEGQIRCVLEDSPQTAAKLLVLKDVVRSLLNPKIWRQFFPELLILKISLSRVENTQNLCGSQKLREALFQLAINRSWDQR
jgi:hypothetical protein